MNLAKAFATILGSLFGGGLLGALAGYLMATFLPNYYITMFPGALYDPVQTGIGLGLTQGVVAGAILGAVIVGILTWREVRLAETQGRTNALGAEE